MGNYADYWLGSVITGALTSRDLLAEATGESKIKRYGERDPTHQLEDEGTTSQGSRELWSFSLGK